MENDICKCNGEKPNGDICPMREKCYRYTCPVDYMQAWLAAPFEGEKCHAIINLGRITQKEDEDEHG